MDLSIALKLLLAAVLGGVIGIEREKRAKPAGLRTNMLICMGATQFMVISVKAATILGGDPTRISAQIITGIGFLGAGSVLHSHGFVTGLTTAATIWVVAGVGMALGAAFYGTAVLVTALTVGTLYLFSFVEDRFQSNRQLKYGIVVSDLEEGLNILNRVLRENKVTAIDLSFKKGDRNHQLLFHAKASRDTNEKILQSLSRETVVTAVKTVARPGASIPNKEHD